MTEKQEKQNETKYDLERCKTQACRVKVWAKYWEWVWEYTSRPGYNEED